MNPVPFSRIFVASLVKELREHAVWAALGGGGLAVLLAATLFAKQRAALGLVGDTYLTVVMIALAAAGFALGLAVTLPDLRRGHFGFAVHRPVPRWTLFAAKLTAAVVLYGLATSLAVGVSAAFAADSRVTHAPFDAVQLLPSLYHQLAGLAWLACGMLVATRRARWFGSRLFPAAVPVITTLLTMDLAIYVHEAAIVALLTAAVLALAAGAYYCHGGRFAPQPLAVKPVSGFVAFAGCGAVLGVCVGVAWGLLQTVQGPRHYTVTEYDRYVIDADGLPYRQHVVNGKAQDLTVDGKPATPPSVPAGGGRVWNTGLNADYSGPDTPRAVRVIGHGFLQSDQYLLDASSDKDGHRWTFDVPRRLLVCYDLDGGPVATLGPDGGVAAGDGTAKPFPPDARFSDGRYGLYNSAVLLSRDAVYLTDLDRRTVRTLFTSADGPVLGVAAALVERDNDLNVTGSGWEDRIDRLRAIVRTAGGLHLVKADGDTGPALPIPPHEWGASLDVTVLPNGDVSALVGRGDRDAPTVLVRRAGGRVTRQTLPALPPSVTDAGPQRWSETFDLAALPPAFLAAKVWADGTLPRPDRVMAVVLAGGAAAVALTWVMARRRGLGRASMATWLTLAAVCGLTTPLALLCLRERPVRVPCPACGKQRRVDVEPCDRCGRPFPPAGHPATAVIENLAAAA